MSDILRSCYSLAKYNNGHFKSEKQAAFLSRSLSTYGGVFTESFSFGEFGGALSTCTVAVQWDEKGIVSIVRTSSKGKQKQVFQRVEESTYQEAQAELQRKRDIMAKLNAEYDRMLAEDIQKAQHLLRNAGIPVNGDYEQDCRYRLELDGIKAPRWDDVFPEG